MIFQFKLDEHFRFLERRSFEKGRDILTLIAGSGNEIVRPGHRSPSQQRGFNIFFSELAGVLVTAPDIFIQFFVWWGYRIRWFSWYVTESSGAKDGFTAILYPQPINKHYIKWRLNRVIKKIITCTYADNMLFTTIIGWSYLRGAFGEVLVLVWRPGRPGLSVCWRFGKSRLGTNKMSSNQNHCSHSIILVGQWGSL